MGGGKKKKRFSNSFHNPIFTLGRQMDIKLRATILTRLALPWSVTYTHKKAYNFEILEDIVHSIEKAELVQQITRCAEQRKQARFESLT